MLSQSQVLAPKLAPKQATTATKGGAGYQNTYKSN